MSALQKFWQWYEKHYVLNVGVSAGLFMLQLCHLFWLTSDVVAFRLSGESFFEPSGIWQAAIVFVDYLEIPTLLSVSLVYINELRKQNNVKSWLYLLMLNSQWIHIFWITDEVVEEVFTGTGSTVLPFWAAWIAILIDYLELPVIYDTLKRFIIALRKKQVNQFLTEFAKEK